MACEGGVGNTNSDVAGLGIIIAFAIQAGISLILSLWAWYLRDGASLLGDDDSSCRGDDDDPGLGVKDQKRTLVEKTLSTVSDIQTMNGIALLVAALAQFQTLDLYHFHIVYDTVNFTALFRKTEGRNFRIAAILTFAALYLAFSILFGWALSRWNDSINGQCYITTDVSAPSASHPYVDKVYLSITCAFVFIVLFLALPPWWDIVTLPYTTLTIRNLFLFEDDGWEIKKENIFTDAVEVFVLLWTVLACAMADLQPRMISRPFIDQDWWKALSRNQRQSAVLVPLLLQYPLHLYMIFTLRKWNATLLEGDSEDSWGFGQILAVVLLAPTIFQCIDMVAKYRRLDSTPAPDSTVELGSRSVDAVSVDPGPQSSVVQAQPGRLNRSATT
ncbi:hypothetical protein M406DRAFT_67758 [Cryphonectria parasitica EP155]|uniref:Uncharacterized protein n=1 Tax=Cryphonectria parasitica (strain ATCC 38755 / EP155) TaxID=660469 RepID=A0A9P5CPD8_CRYP1|nr:uncharacterized protein M406DRAFT_67758 [Cryphonectria parasitica EP155]KAF3765302.1 hypothetical protein M406DRAFT_67758 [Cryphonectria parasitica EP155]